MLVMVLGIIIFDGIPKAINTADIKKQTKELKECEKEHKKINETLKDIEKLDIKEGRNQLSILKNNMLNLDFILGIIENNMRESYTSMCKVGGITRDFAEQYFDNLDKIEHIKAENLIIVDKINKAIKAATIYVDTRDEGKNTKIKKFMG